MNNRAHLVDHLIDFGLIQFGLFSDEPVRFKLHMLPSYPDLLHRLVHASLRKLDLPGYDHLLADPESVPLGVLMSVHASLPLVYSRGTREPAVNDLVGAYDVGHPALFIANIWQGNEQQQRLIANAARVGLTVRTVLCLFRLTQRDVNGVDILSLFDFQEELARLVSLDRLPAGQAAAVQSWLAAQ